MKAISGKIYGKVQGVGFRMYAFRQADRLGLYGWIKNCPDGSVEFHCEGSDVDLCYFMELVKRGNGFSHTEHVEFSDIALLNLSSFEVVV